MKDIKILYEDSDIYIVDKPSGIVVNRADTQKNIETLQDFAEKMLKSEGLFDPSAQSDFTSRAGIVHRLDKETSGVLILTKNENSFKALQLQFKEGSVEKTYITLVHGRVIQAEGEINAPIGRLPWDRTKFGILPMGRESKTLYKKIEEYFYPNSQDILSLVEVYPRTGRTHQIRVHFRYIGNPLFGDSTYGGRKNSTKDRKLLPRHFLHAKKIIFTQPTLKKRISVEAPLSSDLSTFLNTLKKVE